MYIVKRNKSGSVIRKGGAIPRLYNHKEEGHGIDLSEINVKEPMKSLEQKTIKGLASLRIKNDRPKKYISFSK